MNKNKYICRLKKYKIICNRKLAKVLVTSNKIRNGMLNSFIINVVFIYILKLFINLQIIVNFFRK